MAENKPLDAMVQSIYDNERTYKEEQLKVDKNWLEATRNVYKHINKSYFQGTDEELANTGMDIMGEFNYNLSLGTIPMSLNIDSATDDEKLSFYYMMDAYDKKDISKDGIMRAFKEMALDPTNYVGVGTLGAGFAGKHAVQQATKAGVKATLKTHIQKILANTTAVGAIEGGLYVGAEDVARQNVAVEAGVQEEIDPTQTAIATGVGATAGAGITKGVEVVGKAIKSKGKK